MAVFGATKELSQVGQRGKARYVVASTYTTKGYCTYLPALLRGLKKVFILKGVPGAGQSNLIRQVGQELMEKGYDVDFIANGLSRERLDGVIVPQLKLAVIDGDPPHAVDPSYPGVVEEIINLGSCLDEEKLRDRGPEIIAQWDAYRTVLHKSSQYLKTAKELYDLWRRQYQQHGMKKELEQLAGELEEEIFKADQPQVRHFFASTLTDKGKIDFIENLTKDCTRCYVLVGHPGTGMAEIAERILAQAVERGYQVEAFHGIYDPEALELIIIKPLQTALLCLPPDRLLPSLKPGQKIIHLALPSQGQEQVEKDLGEEFRLTVSQAVKCLGEAKKIYEAIEGHYHKALAADKLDHLHTAVLEKVAEWEKNQLPRMKD